MHYARHSDDLIRFETKQDSDWFQKTKEKLWLRLNCVQFGKKQKSTSLSAFVDFELKNPSRFSERNSASKRSSWTKHWNFIKLTLLILLLTLFQGYFNRDSLCYLSQNMREISSIYSECNWKLKASRVGRESSPVFGLQGIKRAPFLRRKVNLLCMQLYMYVCIYIHTYIHIVCMQLYMYVCIYIHTCILYMYTIHVCMYIYTYCLHAIKHPDFRSQKDYRLSA